MRFQELELFSSYVLIMSTRLRLQIFSISLVTLRSSQQYHLCAQTLHCVGRLFLSFILPVDQSVLYSQSKLIPRRDTSLERTVLDTQEQNHFHYMVEPN